MQIRYCVAWGFECWLVHTSWRIRAVFNNFADRKQKWNLLFVLLNSSRVQQGATLSAYAECKENVFTALNRTETPAGKHWHLVVGSGTAASLGRSGVFTSWIMQGRMGGLKAAREGRKIWGKRTERLKRRRTEEGGGGRPPPHAALLQEHSPWEGNTPLPHCFYSTSLTPTHRTSPRCYHAHARTRTHTFLAYKVLIHPNCVHIHPHSS